MFKKINWKNPWVYGTLIVSGILLFSSLIALAYRQGGKNALENELLTVNRRIGNISARINSDEHLKLLARRKALQELLKTY